MHITAIIEKAPLHPWQVHSSATKPNQPKIASPQPPTNGSQFMQRKKGVEQKGVWSSQDYSALQKQAFSYSAKLSSLNKYNFKSTITPKVISAGRFLYPNNGGGMMGADSNRESCVLWKLKKPHYSQRIWSRNNNYSTIVLRGFLGLPRTTLIIINWCGNCGHFQE